MFTPQFEINQSHFIESAGSTNDWIRSSGFPSGSWVVAKNQSDGRGRQGRKWSILGEQNLIFSGKLDFVSGTLPPVFSLFCGIGLLEALELSFPNTGMQAKLKWPNDLYKDRLKVAGILVETEIQGELIHAVVGIGLNLYGIQIPEELPEAGFYLNDPAPENWKESFLPNLIQSINGVILDMEDSERSMKRIQWAEERLFGKGEWLQYRTDSGLQTKQIIGLSDEGAIRLKSSDGEVTCLFDMPLDAKFVSGLK